VAGSGFFILVWRNTVRNTVSLLSPSAVNGDHVGFVAASKLSDNTRRALDSVVKWYRRLMSRVRVGVIRRASGRADDCSSPFLLAPRRRSRFGWKAASVTAIAYRSPRAAMETGTTHFVTASRTRANRIEIRM